MTPKLILGLALHCASSALTLVSRAVSQPSRRFLPHKETHMPEVPGL